MYNDDKSELAFYRKLLGSINASIYVLNLDPYRLEWICDNEFLPRIMQCSHSELMAQAEFVASSVLELPDFKEAVESSIEKFQKDPDAMMTGVYRIMGAKGKMNWIVYGQSAIEKDENGKTTKAVVVTLDPAHLLNTPQTLDAFLSYVRKERHKSIKDSLTDKQEIVLKLLLKNMSVPEIAKTMDLSVHTIKDHKKAIFKKLDCKKVNELFAVALKYGLTE